MRLRIPGFTGVMLFALALTTLGCGGDEGAVDAGDTSPDNLDPCHGLARCSPPGTQCNGDTLVICAVNAQGCLVETYQDCDDVPDGYCNDYVDPAVCSTGRACAGRPTCEVEGRVCEDDTLVICETDQEGCLVEQSIDCMAITSFEFGGECDDTLNPPACVALPDPCADVENRCARAGQSCEDDTLVICDEDEDGCLVESTVDCTETAEVCHAEAEPEPDCVDPCSLVEVCGTASYCEENTLVTCALDENDCLVPDEEQNCLTGRLICDDTIDPPACVEREVCEEAMPLSCSSGVVTASTADTDTANPPYATDRLTGYDCIYGSYNGNEYIFVFTNDLAAHVSVAATRLGTTGDFDLFALYASDSVCAEESLLCLDYGAGTSVTESVDFSVLPGEYVFVVYDIWSSSADPATTDFNLEVTCRICGDGDVTSPEACDDNNGEPGDGCSTTCSVEAGYSCSGEPSVCHRIECGNGFIETGEQCDDDDNQGGDGCSATCQVEDGYSCRGEPSICAAWECGNGIIEPGEDCDDDGTASLDGCSSFCVLEAGYICISEPSQCYSGGDTCDEAIPLVAGTYTLDNTDFTNDYTGYTSTACGNSRSGSGPDMVFSVDVPGRSRLVASMDGSPSYLDEVMALVSSCTDLVNQCLAYGDDPTADVEHFNASTEPVELYLVADGYNSDDYGAFNLAISFEPVVCGDGVVEEDEECDDGDEILADGDGCSIACELETDWACEGQPSICHTIRCDDGVAEGGEECDLGEGNDDLGRCTSECLWAACGDGFVNSAATTVQWLSPVVTNPFGATGHVCDDFSECTSYVDCDVSTDGSAPEHGICQALGHDRAISVNWGDGAGSTDSVMPHAYNWSCADFVCGPSDSSSSSDNCGDSEMLHDITCQAWVQEQCDEGEDNSDDPDAASGCRTDCTPVRCGDGIEDSGEECDDGNTVDGDACLTTCTNAFCGDGYVWAAEFGGTESCDDAEETPDGGDGCSTYCAVEEGWGCREAPSVCHEIECGDGFVDAPETCDDGEETPDDADGCSAACIVEDGYVCTGEPSTCIAGVIGDICETAIVLGEGTYTYDTTGMTADYTDYAGGCEDSYGYGTADSRDMVFRVTVPAGDTLTVTQDPTDYFDAVLLIASTCPDVINSCMVLGDSGNPEEAMVTNSSASAVAYYVIADGYFASSSYGEFELTISID